MDATGGGTLAGIGTVISGIENVQLTTGTYGDVVNLLAITGNHSISTGDGNDNVKLGAGVSYADGGSGSDVLTVDMSTSTSSIASDTNYYYHYALSDTEGLNSINTNYFDTYNITTGSGDDKIVGWGGNDTLNGGAGKDLLTGNAGNDILTGGAGNDVFNFAYSGNGLDTIKDATAGDIIRINSVTLTGGVSAGNGANVGIGQVQLTVNNTTSISTLYIGTDGTPGTDVAIRLEGIYNTNSFSLSGTDITLINSSTSAGSTGNDTLLGSSGNDTLSGGVGDDLLSGDDGDDSLLGEVGIDTLDGGQGNDSLDGGDGNDVLIGGLGSDTLQGGLGADSFQYTDILESSPGIAYRDVISDFNSVEGDKIDLSLIDANAVLAGDQAFKFVGTSFTGSAGEVIYNDGVVSVDINADGLIDMEIQLIGTPLITATDFIL
jgi:Ca2+-binding RTX toxin-like protein